MNITLSPEMRRRVAEKVERGDARTADALVEEALHFYLDYDDSELGAEELRETKAAIDQALAEGARGEGRSAEEVFAGLRAKRLPCRGRNGSMASKALSIRYARCHIVA